MSSGAETRTRNPSVNSRTLCQLSYPGSADHASRLVERFWAKVDLSGDCWLWTGAVNSRGYGQFAVDGRSRSAHRLAYEALVEAIPRPLTVDHLCRVKRCVNPAHMEIVTAAENKRRADEANGQGASATSCVRGHALTEDNVLRNGRGWRYCRTCHNEARRAKRAARAAA